MVTMRNPNYRLDRIHARIAIREPELRRAVSDRDNHTCVDCGSREELELWHVKPVIYGGETVLDNLVTLCKTCRLHKPLD